MKWQSAVVGEEGEDADRTGRNAQRNEPRRHRGRHNASGAVALLAQKVDCSVVNAGDGSHEHPTQALLDALTIRRHKQRIDGLIVAICGDVATAASPLQHPAADRPRRRVRLIGPSTLVPGAFREMGLETYTSMRGRPRDDDIVMMLRLQRERMQGSFVPSVREYFHYWGLDEEKLSFAKPDALVMHPGPMNRGVEIDPAVADGPQSLIREQVEMGVAIRMAVLDAVVNASGNGGRLPDEPDDPDPPAVADQCPRRRSLAGLRWHWRRADDRRPYRRRRSVGRQTTAPPKAPKSSTAVTSSSHPASSTSAPMSANPAMSIARPSPRPDVPPLPAASPRWSPCRTPIRPSTIRRWWSSSRHVPAIPRWLRVRVMAALTKGQQGSELTEFGLLQEAGAVGSRPVVGSIANAQVLRRALTYGRDFGALVCNRPEDAALKGSAVMNLSETAVRLGLQGIRQRPRRTMLARDLRIARLAGGRYHASLLSASNRRS